MTTLGEIAENKKVKELFPSIVTAITGNGKAANPVRRHARRRSLPAPALLVLSQWPRPVRQTGRHVVLVREGDNRYHAIFGTDGPALFVNASSLGRCSSRSARPTAPGADGKKRDIRPRSFSRRRKSESERETALRPNEILTAITILARREIISQRDVRSASPPRSRLVARHGVRRVSSAKRRRSNPQIVLGHVAATPWVATKAAQALSGQKIDEGDAKRCGDAAADGAKPLSGNAYKIQLVKTAVKRALLAAASA